MTIAPSTSNASSESGSTGARFWARQDVTESDLKLPNSSSSSSESLSVAFKMLHSLFLRRLARQINQTERDTLNKRANARPKATLKPEVVLDEAEKVWMDMNRNIKARKRRRREQERQDQHEDEQEEEEVEQRAPSSRRRRRQAANNSQEK